jgi:hypothetical protein
MTTYVIGPEVAIRLAHEQAVIRDEHQILAPNPSTLADALARLPGSEPG